MKILMRLLSLAMAVLITLGVCGCMNNNFLGNGARKESDAEYLKMMEDYMEEKYATSFDVVESILAESGINSGMEINVLVLRDSAGRTTNVRAKFGTPYRFYDDYVQVRSAAEILSKLEVSKEHIEALGLYVVVRNKSIDSIDVSPENIPTLTVVAKVPEEPNDENLRALYEVYNGICSAGYKEVYFLAGFVKESSDFDAAVANYTVHGKSKWSDYNGDFYAYLRTTSDGLSFEEFKSGVEK